MAKLIYTTLTLLISLQISARDDLGRDQYFNKQWYLHYKNDEMGLDIQEAWNLTKTKKDVVIAVIDTGVDYNHKDLKGNIWKNSKEIPNNGIDDDKNGYIDDVIGWNFSEGTNDPMDVGNYSGHGTHVAGIIGAKHNSTGIAGIVPNVKIMALKVFPNASWGKVAKAVQYAVDNGALVINLSLGAAQGSSEIEAALKYALQKNVIVVCAAGNDSSSQVSYPANYDFKNVIAVSSTDSKMFRSEFSNYGSRADIFAPGSEIFSLAPGNKYVSMSGTSMAAPVVVGVVGLIIAYNGTSSIKTMKDRLQFTSMKIRNLAGKVRANGIIHPFNAIVGQQSIEFFSKEPTTNK